MIYWMIFLFSVLSLIFTALSVVIYVTDETGFDSARSKITGLLSCVLLTVLTIYCSFKSIEYAKQPIELGTYWKSNTYTKTDYVVHQEIFCVDLSLIADRCSLIKETVTILNTTSGSSSTREYKSDDLSSK